MSESGGTNLEFFVREPIGGEPPMPEDRPTPATNRKRQTALKVLISFHS